MASRAAVERASVTVTTRTQISIPPGRTRNLTWDAHETCAYCADEGQLVIGTRQELVKATRTLSDPVEEFGPCPMCARGFCLEFAFGRRRVMRGQVEVVEEYQGQPPWGPDGYWASRMSLRSELRPAEVSGKPVDAVNKQRAGEMLSRSVAGLRGMSSPLTGRDERAAERDVLASVALLPLGESGVCGDCGERGGRVRYGKVLVCVACAAGRARTAARLGEKASDV